MNRNKLFSTSAAAMVLAAQLFVPASALALELDASVNARVDAEGIIRPNVCERIAIQMEGLVARLDGGRKGIDERRAGVLASLEDRAEDRAEKLAALRAREDAKHTEISVALNAKATTTAHKNAIIEFQADVEAAVKARRAATERANKAFQDGLHALLNERKTRVDAATAAYKTAVQNALAAFKVNCGKNLDRDESAMATFRKAIANARAQYQASAKRIDSMDTRLKALLDAHKASLEKAQTDFHAAMEKARIELKAAFSAEAES